MRDTVQADVAMLEAHAGRAVGVALGLVGLWLGWKLWQITASHAHPVPRDPGGAFGGPGRRIYPLMLDLRGASMIAETGPIAGAGWPSTTACMKPSATGRRMRRW